MMKCDASRSIVFVRLFVSILFITQNVFAETHVDWSRGIGGDDGMQGGQVTAIGSDDCIYVAGITTSTNFPVKNAFQSRLADDGVYGRGDLFISKITSDGSNVIYSTYLGGCAEETLGNIKLDSSNNLYIAGFTSSSNFPAVNGIHANLDNVARNAFLVKLDPTGRVVFATCFGTNVTTIATAVDIDAGGNIYIGGSSGLPSFPGSSVLTQTNNPGYGGFISKYGPSGTNRIFATFVGGEICAIAVDYNGRVNFAGTAGEDSGVKVSSNAFHRQYGGGRSDVFAGRLGPHGTNLDFLTYLGGDSEQVCNSMALDSSGNLVLVGWTSSSNFPVSTNAVQCVLSGENDGFVSVVSSDGSGMIYSTYLGGNDEDSCTSVSCTGNVVHVVGDTASTNFPTFNPIQVSSVEKKGGFISILRTDAGNFCQSSYLGRAGYDGPHAVATDAKGVISVAGIAGGKFYPLIPFPGNTGGRGDCLIMKISK